MTQKKTVVLVNKSGDNNGRNASDASALGSAKPSKIKAQPNVKYLLKGEGDTAPANATLTRVGDDLHITLEGEKSPALVLEGYFSLAQPPGIYGVAQDGQLYAYGRTDGGAIFSLADGGSSMIALAGNPIPPGEDDDFAFWPLMLVGGFAAAGFSAVKIGGGSKYSALPEVVKDAPPPEKSWIASGVKGAIDDVGAVTGPIANGEETDDTRPEFKGKGDAGSTIIIEDNGQPIGTAKVGEDGTWSFTPEVDLAEGEHSIVIIETDKAGNESDASDPYEFTVDTTPPDASKLAINGVADDVGAVTGNVDRGQATDDSRPVISGTGTTGDTIIVMVKDDLGSRELGRTTVDENGEWTLAVTTPLVSGNNEFTAIEMDLAGNATAPSAPYAVVVDVTVPTVPVIQNVQDDKGDVHFMQKGEVTDDAKPTIIGTADKGSTIAIYDGATLLGAAQADANGNWNFTPTDELKDGAHSITATATNSVGQTSEATGIWNFAVDTAKPDAVSDLVVTDDVGARTGPLSSGDTTDDSAPTFVGTAEPGSTVSVYDNGVKIGEAEVDETTGDWSFTPSTPLADGDHAFTTVVTDPAGNASAPSSPVNVTIDTTDVTVSIGALLDDQGAITDNIAPNGVTDDLRPEIQGTGKAGSTITVYDGDTELGTTEVKPDGTWNFTPETDLSEGEHSITATATDKAGEVSEPTAPFNFSVDTQKPEVPSIGVATDDVGAIQGPLADGDTTDDPTPTLSGTAERDSTVSVYDNGNLLGTAKADDQGNWRYTPTTPLPEGEHEFTVTATDKAGNVSDKSDPFTLITDYTGPDATVEILGIADDTGVPTDFITKDDSITVSGSISRPLEDGERVQISSDGGSTWTDVNVVGQTWTSGQTSLSEGENTFDVRIIDKAGNPGGTDNQVVTLDTTPPTQTVSIVSYVDDEGSIAGEFDFNSHPTTGDASPLLKGTLSAGLAAGDSVEIYRDGVLLGTASVNGTDWTFQDGGLDNGDHVYTAKVVDLAGNAGATSDPAALTRESLLSLQANDTVVHEAALNGGTGKDWLADDGSDTSDLSASGTFNLGPTVTGITITLGGQPTGLTLADLASGKTVTVGGDTLTITNLGSGQYGYTYTLVAPKSHDTSGANVGEIVNNDFKITATNDSGRSVSATGEIRVVNDEVTASPDDFVIDMPNVADGVVITLILDHSGSMLTTDGNPMSRWNLAKEATLNLLDKYAESYPDSTSFEINLVVFDGASGATNYTSIAAAKAAINAVPDPTNGGTNYRAALEDAQRLIQASMSKDPDHDQKVYFITDGVPSVGFEQPAGWSTFVTDNKDALDVYAVGLGPAVDTPTATDEIKKVLAAGDPTDLFIPVVNAEDLSDALMETLPIVDGNLFDATANGRLEGVALGADGGFTISQVTIGGVDYTLDSGGVVTIKVASGLTMTLDEQGNYKIITSVASPNLKVPMTFTLTDADGDTSVVTEQLQFGDPSRSPLVIAAHETGVRRDASAAHDGSWVDAMHRDEGLGSFFDVKAADELVGTAGNDTFRVNAADFGHLGGGIGFDTLVMDARDIHINGADGEVDLLGGEAGPDGWAAGGATQVGGVTYNVYTNLVGTAELLVENKVHVAIL